MPFSFKTLEALLCTESYNTSIKGHQAASQTAEHLFLDDSLSCATGLSLTEYFSQHVAKILMPLKGIEKASICCFHLTQIFFIAGTAIKNNLFYCILKRSQEVHIVIYFKYDISIKSIVNLEHLKYILQKTSFKYTILKNLLKNPLPYFQYETFRDS